MLAVERRQKILDLVYRHKTVQVTDLSKSFGVTEETIRRDLQTLDGSGLLSRTHGGAVAREVEAEDLPYRMRQVTNIEAKRKIAALAAALVHDAYAVMIDSSSTAFEVLSALKDHHDLTLITNSVRITANPGATQHTIVSVGGELRKQSMTFVGTLATQAIAKFNADIALISCKAISISGGVMDASLPDAEVKRAFIAAARKVCLLVDGDKFDGSALTSVCPVDQINAVITDRQPSDEWIKHFQKLDIPVLY
ncbi:DeoR/GlpR family DNA-binding transcription regulator [Rhizobium sp. WYCCWR 11128]|uniref:DeoR/GlpR family DNA-binding transcription regulator n=1 Tax=Rhizobium sp. WYCCWR 11128 TaxID=2749832 RepID=UPI0015D25600|nr:DeoR/GlpR family DNA-binding transcription regulator [Rhizobium sp. WYCCWR 11128]NYT30892.1 DeoR/GlpR transcriptional regulator [Rhizobium sp. WYCCWR 11128]